MPFFILAVGDVYLKWMMMLSTCLMGNNRGKNVGLVKMGSVVKFDKFKFVPLKILNIVYFQASLEIAILFYLRKFLNVTYGLI